MTSVARSFGFNASAVAFGGLFKSRRGKSSQAIQGNEPSVALSPAGGRVESFVKSYKGEKGVSFRNALTVVEGTIDSGVIYTTTVTSQLENLDVFGLVTADAVTSVLRSQRNIDKDDDSIFTIEATFRNLKVVGAKVDPPLDLTLFSQVPTYRHFVEFFSKQKNMKRYATSFGWNPKDDTRASAAALIAAANEGRPLGTPEPIRCSLVTDEVQGSTFRQDGYSLILNEGLGTVHLAEMLVKPGLRRINMLRLELQKPGLILPKVRRSARGIEADRDAGDTYNATVCSGEGNGSQTYP